LSGVLAVDKDLLEEIKESETVCGMIGFVSDRKCPTYVDEVFPGVQRKLVEPKVVQVGASS
jgi:hypothetical protein